MEYYNRTHDLYFENVIAENLYSQVEPEGHQFLVLEYIDDNWSDGTDITVTDGLIISRGGNKHPKKITRGWELITQMKEGF